MRRLLALLLCLALLPIMPALAEARAQVSLFQLTSTDEDGRETPIGSAILALDWQLLLTSVIVDDPAALKAYAPDGSVYRVLEAVKGGGGLVLLVLDQAVNGNVVEFSALDARNARLVGVTMNGLLYDMPVLSLAKTVYQDQDAYLVSARERLRPGAVLLDSEGGLIGITVAEWGEGEARYVALTGEAMIEAFLANAQEEPRHVENPRVENPKGENPKVGGRTSWLLDAQLGYWDGMLVVDWSESEIAGLNSRSVITVYIECADNNYYVYDTSDPSELVMLLDVVPGHEYSVWVNHTYGTQDFSRTAENAITVKIPEAGAFTDYGFTDDCYLAWAPAEDTPDVSERLPALAPITAAALEDDGRKLYLQAVNTYEVDEELETSLILVLQTPEGYIFHSLNGYIFMPEIQEEDVWNADVTPLFKRYLLYNDTSSFAPGEYTLSYLIGGKWAGSFTFTIE